ncbi:MAG TPA: hypothetical protein VEY30_01275, partial [Myxococcaceae bacterium]|nr:hypothetical protein [Myxococcaceae bacterium]
MKRNSDATQAKLLVVDAWTGSAEAVAALTRAAGFRVVTLSRAEAVAPLYQTFLPRLAVIAARETDSALAFEAARRLREISRGALPVVF